MIIDNPLIFTGKISTFGGPDDTGVSKTEGLALVEFGDLQQEWFARNFEPKTIWHSLFGLARNLDPMAFYIAMRWNQCAPNLSREEIRRSIVRISTPSCRYAAYAQPIDYGPGDGSVVDGQQTQDTRRIADLSPGCAKFLFLKTDDIATCEIIPAGVRQS